MKSSLPENTVIPKTANYIYQGTGVPVILIHGLAASLHDWNDLIPELSSNGYASYALDLLGHGDSPKPSSRAYQMDWIFEHFSEWVASLNLREPAILIGHSMGGYIALEYARRLSPGTVRLKPYQGRCARTRGLVLVDPFYSRSQLPRLLRHTYSHANWSSRFISQTPEWLFRFFVDLSSVATGHSIGGMHSLPEKIRAQTALDFKRTAPGVYHIPNAITDLTQYLPEIHIPTLVIWGDRDQTLAPSSFSDLVSQLPKARGEVLRAGHVPHQSHADAFNQIVMEFLKGLA